MSSREKFLKGLKWALIGLVSIFIIAVIARIPHVIEVEKSKELVAKIHATKLTLKDVWGDNLPPDPGIEADKTVEGIDWNKNGIRDDVELAIFQEYPDSARIRAALLQYALALQMETAQPFLNNVIAAGVVDQQDRAFFCMGDIYPEMGQEGAVLEAIFRYGKFLSSNQFNTNERKDAHKDFYSLIKSGRIENWINCDIDMKTLTK